MNTVNRRLVSSSNGSSNGLSGYQFLVREELEVETIMHRNLSSLNSLWNWIDPAVLRFLGDVFPVGPMKPMETVILSIAFNYGEKYRKPCEIYQAIKSEGVGNGHIWNLVWLLARIRGNDDLWERYVGCVALGSPISDGWSGLRFPYIDGTAGSPSVRLVSEMSIGNPSRRLKYICRPIDASYLQMAKSPLS